MKIGLVLAVYKHLSLPDALRKAAMSGYQMVELQVQKDNGLIDLNEIATSIGANRLLSLLRSYNLELSALDIHAESQLLLGPHSEVTDSIYQGTSDEKISYAMKRLELAAIAASRLNVPVVCGFSGCPDGTRWFPWPDPKGWEKMQPIFVERWSSVLDIFGSYGIKFAHECHPNQFAYNIETALESIALLKDRPEWGFNLDPGNLMLAGVDPILFVAELGPKIFHVHAKDGELVKQHAERSGLLARGDWERRDRGFRFRVPGWGDLDWRRLITELRLINYDYALSIEHEDPTMSRDDGVVQGIAHLRPLLIQNSFEGRWW